MKESTGCGCGVVFFFILPVIFLFHNSYTDGLICHWFRITPLVNQVHNEIVGITDVNAYGLSDFWQYPQETLRLKRGDCEDQAILLAYLIEQKTGEYPEIVIGHNEQTAHAWVVYNGWYYDPALARSAHYTTTYPEYRKISYEEAIRICDRDHLKTADRK